MEAARAQGEVAGGATQDVLLPPEGGLQIIERDASYRKQAHGDILSQ